MFQVSGYICGQVFHGGEDMSCIENINNYKASWGLPTSIASPQKTF
jgi:hypothetical protein